MKIGMSGHFRIEKRESGSDKLLAVREFDNLITNRGLDGYGMQVSGLCSRCYIGQGTNAPSVSDRQMGSYAGSAYINSFRTAAPVAPDYVSSVTTTYRFNAGQVVGNFTEVGIGNVSDNPTNQYLWSRALILNEQGGASSITVLPNEYLDVYYTLYFHPPVQSFVNFDVEIEYLGTTHNVTGRLAKVQGSWIETDSFGSFHVQSATINAVKQNSTALGDITETVNGVETDESASGYPYHPIGTLLPYEEGSYKRASVFSFGLLNDNYENGISGIEFFTGAYRMNYTMNMYAQYLISPPIPKTEKRELDLTFEWSWGRHGG